jgi:general stress protein 26
LSSIMVKPNATAQSILDAINYATIATVDSDTQPWNTPVAVFRFDNDYALYWASWQDNQHSLNIRTNGKAFVVVYDSTPVGGRPSAGVYMQGQALELIDEQEVMRAALVFEGDPYNPSDGIQYLGNYPRRIYKFVPEQIWMNDDDTVNGSFVDIRKEATA